MSIVRTELERLCETEQRLLNTISKAEKTLAKLEYVAMMTDVDIPIDESEEQPNE